MYFFDAFLLYYLLHNSQKITNFIAYKQGVYSVVTLF